jgi:hypothetical protein
MMTLQELDVVWEKHDAGKDHVSCRQSKREINSVVATKDRFEGCLLGVLHGWISETVVDEKAVK